MVRPAEHSGRKPFWFPYSLARLLRVLRIHVSFISVQTETTSSASQNLVQSSNLARFSNLVSVKLGTRQYIFIINSATGIHSNASNQSINFISLISQFPEYPLPPAAAKVAFSFARLVSRSRSRSPHILSIKFANHRDPIDISGSSSFRSHVFFTNMSARNHFPCEPVIHSHLCYCTQTYYVLPIDCSKLPWNCWKISWIKLV